jgi:2-polyprenyl-6-methoxyphenol hydroxylase-like FAD-dependent oxidoreductase
VLIVGAGPTGLLMACQLALRNVPFRIVDRSEDHTTQSRALVVQARSLEIFDQMGIAQEALDRGVRARTVGLIVNGKRVFELPVGTVGEQLTAYPYLLMLEQSQTEAILGDLLNRLGHTVERSTELLDFTDSGDIVTATVRHGDGTAEVVEADWVIGADGAHSLVRQMLGIPFDGKTYEQSLFVLDCEVRPRLPPDAMYVVMSDRAFTGFFPLTDGRSRVLGTVPPGLENRDSLTFEDVATDFDRRVRLPVRLQNPAWLSLYRSHHRVVSTFRKGRCFLAGDAAHIHSPVGAQGMNTGLQDAHNLAWKLALVIQGRANQSLLDTYHDERITIARRLVRTTDRAFNYVNSQHPLLKTARLKVLPLVMPIAAPLALRQRFLRELVFRTVSQIGIHYRSSVLSQEAPDADFPRSAPLPGDRVPYVPAQGRFPGSPQLVRGTKLHLVSFSGASSESDLTAGATQALLGFADLIECHDVPLHRETQTLYRVFGVRERGYYLIRPDGYIATRGISLESDELHHYLQTHLQPVSAT